MHYHDKHVTGGSVRPNAELASGTAVERSVRIFLMNAATLTRLRLQVYLDTW